MHHSGVNGSGFMSSKMDFSVMHKACHSFTALFLYRMENVLWNFAQAVTGLCYSEGTTQG